MDGSAPFFGVEEVGPHLTKIDWPRPTPIPSGILIHPAVWPQRTQIGGSAPLGQGELGSHLTQCGRSRGLPARQVSP